MIKTSNLHKYFFRRKSNEIHVINDVNLELPSKGLVVLLGPSGSGKTTLLNVLGGLDKAQSGTIDFDGEVISSYRSHTWDKIRNKKIGYIFQNYNLLTHMTVYENIELSLTMAGITDKEEIDKRIDYILEQIGMINFRRRRAFQLSGGQQQRVAIARALAKNPKVIIADEPTGNLDSKNSLEVMNIIKSISKEKLVILVTHEQELANFYADRLIKLEDGQIVSDDAHLSEGDLEYRHESDIYLKELKQVTNLEEFNTNFKVYTDEDNDPDFKVRIVVKNKTVYVEIDNDDYHNIKVIDKNSEVRLLDKKYKKATKETLETKEFNFDEVADDTKVDKKKSVISNKESLRYAFQRFINARVLGKILYFGFAFVAALIALAVGAIAAIYTIEPSQYLQGEHKDAVYVTYDEDLTYDDYLAFEENKNIDYLMLARNNHQLDLIIPPVYQAYDIYSSINIKPAIVDYMDGRKIAGRTVQSPDEIVIDKYVADQILSNESFVHLGIDSYEDILSLEFDVQFNSNGLPVDPEEYATSYRIKIVGIYKTQSPVYYGFEETIYMIETRLPIYEVFQDQLVINDGNAPMLVDDVLVSYDEAETNTLEDILVSTVFGIKSATGTFTSTEKLPPYLLPLEGVKEAVFGNYYPGYSEELTYHANNPTKASSYFDSLSMKHVNYAALQYASARAEKLSYSIGTLIFTGTILGAASISYFFVIRSSLLSRIYEVSVYRALGASRLDIMKIFAVEIIVITTLTSIPGFALMTYGLSRVQAQAGGFVSFYVVSPLSVLFGVSLIYIVNLLSGLFPVAGLLRKTPAEILSRYDF